MIDANNTENVTELKAPAAFNSVMARTVFLPTPKDDFERVCVALCLQSKNLFNTTHFAVNNVMTAYSRVVVEGDDAATAKTRPYRLINAPYQNQWMAISRFNATIEKINANRQEKFDAAVALGGKAAKDAKLKLIPLLGEEVKSLTAITLDLTVLDNLLRDWPNKKRGPVYRRMPAKASQQVLKRYKDGWSGFFESLKSYSAGSAGMTGRPRAPSYMAKTDRFILELPLTQIGPLLIGLGDREIPVDYAETMSLTQSQMEAWNGYRVEDAVAKAVLKAGFDKAAKPKHLRIVPNKLSVKIEAVIEVPRVLPQDSLLAKVEEVLGAEALSEMRPAARNSALVDAIKDRTDIRVAGVDFGVKNTATVAFSNGGKGVVISGGRLNRVLSARDKAIDAKIGSLVPKEIRDLQQEREVYKANDCLEKFSRADFFKLKAGLAAVHRDDEVVAMRKNRQSWLNDYAHKLTHDLVELCKQQGINTIVLGQNTGWKTGVNMGRAQNRQFYRIPIARMIELIRYKAEAYGIVVVTTEESFTSATSFVNDIALQVYSKKEKTEKTPKSSKAKKISKAKSLAVDGVEQNQSEAQASIQETPKFDFGGRRLSDERNTFVNTSRASRLAWIHADLNGAFNIIRKVFGWFHYHSRLNIKHQLMRMSPHCGLSILHLKKNHSLVCGT